MLNVTTPPPPSPHPQPPHNYEGLLFLMPLHPPGILEPGFLSACLISLLVQRTRGLKADSHVLSSLLRAWACPVAQLTLGMLVTG